MAKIALLFAGQGAQYPGMGKDFFEQSAAAQAVFQQLEGQRPGTLQQCFTGSKEELSLTINTQPCLFAVDYAIASAVQEAGITVDAVAGFSLGEIPALAFAGMLELPQAFALVCRRAEVMQQAAEANPGGMQAILKLDAETIEQLAQPYSEVFPVNYNSPQQTAVAGAPEQLQAFAADVKAAGGRAVPLAVSGAFHSPYMDSAAEKLADYLQPVTVQQGRCTVYANRTAQPYTLATAKELIASQVNHPVQWVKTINQMIADGVNCFIEVGPGKTLSGLVKKINAEVQVYKVENQADLAELLQSIQ
ncbi:MAG: ACP S-malonyltransferase [Peptococcaceae bacterium]